jgi:superfamily I DNA/RNA helicase
MSISVESLRQIDHRYRIVTYERTKAMCETVEFYAKLENDCEAAAKRFRNGRDLDEETKRCVHRKVKAIRKNKKSQFWMNSGTVKLSTIHSLKGWEVHTLFFIVEGEMMEESLAELVYAGFTRCTNNLVIFNVGSRAFHAFVQSIADEVGVEFCDVNSRTEGAVSQTNAYEDARAVAPHRKSRMLGSSSADAIS